MPIFPVKSMLFFKVVLDILRRAIKWLNALNNLLKYGFKNVFNNAIAGVVQW